MNKQYQLTQDGVKELQAELEALKAKRIEIAEAIKSARELGDLSENAEYQAAREDQERNDNRLAEVERILGNSQLIRKSGSGSKVGLGSVVKLKGDKGAKEFQVVGTVEADPLEGKISDESPIGRILMGKQVGDLVEIATPNETNSYKVAEIS